MTAFNCCSHFFQYRYNGGSLISLNMVLRFPLSKALAFAFLCYKFTDLYPIQNASLSISL